MYNVRLTFNEYLVVLVALYAMKNSTPRDVINLHPNQFKDLEKVIERMSQALETFGLFNTDTDATYPN